MERELIPFIDLKPQRDRISTGLTARINRIHDHSKYILGPEVQELEGKLADFTGSKFCIACGNGTDALQLALMTLDLNPGDEVIVPDFSFFATSECASILGLRPVFVDIDEKTYNIDPAEFERAITKKTKAVIPVSLYGQCPDFDRINEIAKKNNITVIEDGAQSFGATYKGRNSCNLSDIATTSFFPSKPLGCYGDGGAIFTNDKTIATKLKQLRAHGSEGRYNHTKVGINSRLDSIQAAVILEKLGIFKLELEMREEVANRYKEGLGEIFEMPYIEDHNTSVYAQFTLRSKQRDDIIRRLKEIDIPAMVHYPKPLSKQPVYSDSEINNPISNKMSDEVFSIPFYPYLNPAQQNLIIEGLRRCK
jgi:UDP-2-acetamido-2-deoxy-ribo-hexuluronate aminotransferase